MSPSWFGTLGNFTIFTISRMWILQGKDKKRQGHKLQRPKGVSGTKFKGYQLRH